MERKTECRLENGVITGVTPIAIPLSPKGEVKEFRRKLRECISQLDAANDRALILDAEFSGTSDTVRTDLENRLFYNVGIGCFARSAQSGIRFRASISTKESSTSEPQFSYRYTLTRLVGPFVPPGEETGFELHADFDDFACLRDWPCVWLGLKQAQPQPSVTANSRDIQNFGICAVLRGPETEPRKNLAGLVKPIFDGITCALHAQSKSATESYDADIVRRLTNRINAKRGHKVTDEKVREFLFDRSSAVLDAVQLVRPSKRTCTCAPSDHLCKAGTLRFESADAWALDAKIFRL